MLRAIVCAILLIGAYPAWAAEVLKKIPGELSPDKAYVVVEVRHFSAIAGTDQPGNIVLARSDAEAGDIRGGTRAPGSRLRTGVPVRLQVTNRAIIKAKASRLYFIELEPDDWVIEGTAGTAFSLGSVGFTLEPGAIVDLGVLSPRLDWREGDRPDTMGDVFGRAMLGVFAKKVDPTPAMLDVRERNAGDIPLPAALANKAVRPVVYTSGQKFGNYLGGLINRIDGRKGRQAATQ